MNMDIFPMIFVVVFMLIIPFVFHHGFKIGKRDLNVSLWRILMKVEGQRNFFSF